FSFRLINVIFTGYLLLSNVTAKVTPCKFKETDERNSYKRTNKSHCVSMTILNNKSGHLLEVHILGT
ncbi:MAG TPA: hypothetical protein VKM37_03870, partial [Balneolaceae bacterium]|nr:hypothetical protein [Balneolaceae bacterium]